MRTIYFLYALVLAKAGFLVSGNPIQVKTKPITSTPAEWLVRLDTNAIKTSVNWPSLKDIIVSSANLKPFTGSDSIDYIGQVYYNTPTKAEGFERTAIKRVKNNGTWAYEAFLKTSTDSNKVRAIFYSLYNELKKTIKDNTGDDFILGSSAKMPISAKSVSWMAMWTLYTNYKGFVPGLGKVRIVLLLSGLPDFLKPELMDYTIKVIVYNSDYKFDFFTWDEPRT